MLVLVSAALQTSAFPLAGPVPGWRASLAWVALVPLLLALHMPGYKGQSLRVRDAALLGYSCGFLWYLGTCYWIYQTMYLYGGLAKPIAVMILVLFSLYLGLYHGLFACLFVLARQGLRSPALTLAVTPAVWVAVELARARVTGFPWDLLGYAQVDNLLLTRLAPLTGVMGISFVLAAANAGLAGAWLLHGRMRVAVPCVSLGATVLLAVGGVLPGVRKAGLSAGAQTAVLLQENLAVGAERPAGQRPMTTAEELSTFIALTESPIAFTDSGHRGMQHPVVVIWPEAPSNFQSNDPYLRSELSDLARRQQAALIAGSLGVDMDPSLDRGYWLYDSASLFTAGGGYQGRYDKIHLVPWGEYVPYKQLFSFADKLTAGVGNMDPGHERTVFHAGGHAYGVFICYESIFGDEVRQFVRGGAEVLVNISDDGWYGDTGAPWQHLNMARMRAIENHRWLLRDTNTGITTAIDPWGRMRFQAPRHTRQAFVLPFDFMDTSRESMTLYTRHGDWFAWLCALCTLAACGWGLASRHTAGKHASSAQAAA